MKTQGPAAFREEAKLKLEELAAAGKRYKRKAERKRLHDLLTMTYALVEEFRRRRQMQVLFDCGAPEGLLDKRANGTVYHSLLHWAITTERRNISRWAKALRSAHAAKLSPKLFGERLAKLGVNALAYPESAKPTPKPSGEPRAGGRRAYTTKRATTSAAEPKPTSACKKPMSNDRTVIRAARRARMRSRQKARS